MNTTLMNADDYDKERENNIVKNIAKEIAFECVQYEIDVSQELANYLVKLKLLNPKNGFTASEVMPRSLTQQLVLSVMEEAKQDTPAMNCIRMQVYWSSVNLNVKELKNEYQRMQSDKAEPCLTELLSLEKEDSGKLPKIFASYVLIYMNLGSVTNQNHLRETMAAIHSVFKSRDASFFFAYTYLRKIERAKQIAMKITGIRLYLKMLNKAGEGIEDVRTLKSWIETLKERVSKYEMKVASRIQAIREAISSVLVTDYFEEDVAKMANVNLPPECDMSDLKYLKQVLVIMLQHEIYLNDISSKLDEIDGNANFCLREYDRILLQLRETIRDRDAVPTSEVYPNFRVLGNFWEEIQSYYYCLDAVKVVVEKLEAINKKGHFETTFLEKAAILVFENPEEKRQEIIYPLPSNVLLLNDLDDVYVEFNGFCTWTLFFGEGFLVPATPFGGISPYNDQYYAFSTKTGHDHWIKNPNYYLVEIYEILRANPEMVELLNVYDLLYSMKSVQFTKKVDRKISTRTDCTQTVLHPIEKYWDKDYTFSEWELKKRALTLSRLMKCFTKSAQTVNHSHYRSSIGILAAPDKDKECQTKRDSSCVHSTIANYLYGLRGHYENKFKVITLTRPPEESCEREILLENVDLCRNPPKEHPVRSFVSSETCTTRTNSSDKCDFQNYTDYCGECNGEEY